MKRLTGFVLFVGSALIASAQPLWWSTRAHVSGQADDYAVANLGQLKNMAMSAAVEMNLRLSGGAGSSINALVSPWWQPASTGVARDDFAVLTQGQLKYVAQLFYNRLAISAPWTASTGDDDDYAAVNLGQLKYVFNFVIAASGDTDADGLLDSWEISNFGGISFQSGADNAETAPEPDALSNRAEYLVGSDPMAAAADVTMSGALGLVVFSP